MSTVLSQLKRMSEKAKETIPALISKLIMEQLHPFLCNEELYTYRNGVYSIQTKKSMLAEIRNVVPDEILDKVSVNAQKNAIELVYARSEALDSIPRHYEYINVQNGIYDIHNDVLLPHHYKYKMTYILSVDYNPNAKSEKFIDFIRQTFKHDMNLIMNAQETTGYMVSDHPPIKEFVLLKGESDTAKSAYLSIIRNIVGLKYVNSVGINDLNNEYYVASLCTKKLNICGECASMVLRDLSMIKQLTSPDDALQIRQIRQATKLVIDRPKMVFASNHYPIIMSDVENLNAFFNRVHIIPFLNIIPKERQIEGYAEMLYKEEGEGILLWMIEGYRRFLSNGKKFTYSDKVEEEQNEYRNYYQLPSIFVEQGIKLTPDKKVFSSSLKEHLKEFCEYNSVKYYPEYLVSVRKILRSKGVINKKVRIRDKVKQGFEGIKLKDYEDDWTDVIQ